MRQHLLLIVTSLLLMVSCQKVNHTPRPKKLLTEEQMAELITDLILLDASMSVNVKTLEEIRVFPNTFITQKYQLDSVEIAQNLDYYNEDKTKNKSIFEAVKTKLTHKKETYDSITAVKDSLKRANLEKRRERKRTSDSLAEEKKK